ncbi:D-alanyl-D-alanine carboxypeptidase family protein [Galactobacter valiniphilus]|uniref:D-alanyl-D-alanine carboxypeptidase family protein n=1 Tax=Galactobacter valiniphilus TaxID=2676122 RepID=UPI003734C6AB
MRELDVPARTRVARSLGAALIFVLIIGAGIGFLALKDQGSVNDGGRSAQVVGSGSAAGSGKGRGEAAPSAAVKAAVRDTRVDPFDESHVAVARLDAGLRAAMQNAARAAAEEGVGEFWLTSGWRTAEYQQALLNDAVKQHGTLKVALRWVKTPETSEHVHGSAADVGPASAAAWMTRNAERFGLCRTYANEAWHYELREGDRCPAPKADAR